MSVWLEAILNGAIASLAPVFLMWLVFRMTPRRVLSAAARYAAWWALLIAILVLPVLYMPFLRSTITAQTDISSPFLAVSEASESVEPEILSLHSGIDEAAPHSAVAGPTVWPRLPIRIDAIRWLGWALAFWCSVSAVLLVRLIASFVLLTQRSARATSAPEELSVQARTWRELCGVRRREPRVALSEEIRIPVAVGFRHPSILFPSRLVDQCPAQEIHWIGLHETAHLARHDDYTLILQRIIESLFPWHIVVRFIGRQLELEREIACDDVVVSTSGASKSYASCLMRVVELGDSSVILAAASAAGRGSHLARRVDALLERTRNAVPRRRQSSSAVLLLILALLLWSMGTAPAMIAFTAAAANEPSSSSAQPAAADLTSPIIGTTPVVLPPDTVISGAASVAQSSPSSFSGQWRVDAVPFAPWILDFRVHGETVSGTVRQNAMDTSGAMTQFAFPVEISGGRTDGNRINFKVLSPDGQRVVSFAGQLKEDLIELNRAIEILPGGGAGREGLFDSTSAHEIAATRIHSTRGARHWKVDGVPFGPWTFNLNIDGASVSGTVSQGGWDAASSYVTELNYPMEVTDGLVKGNSVFFTVTPDKDRKVTFEGSIQGDTLVLSRQVEVRPGGDAGRDGLYGSKGLPQFEAQLIR